MGPNSCLADHVDCYNVAPVTIAYHGRVAMYTFLCTASKDYTIEPRPTIARPITICEGAWLCADVFIGPGVTVGKHAVVAARSTVIRDVEEWVVVAGNPAHVVKRLQNDTARIGNPGNNAIGTFRGQKPIGCNDLGE